MGSLILCHTRKAKQPYEINRLHLKIYTIEELCYYVYNHLYLIDYTLTNRQLCDWLGEELGLQKLANQLREMLNSSCSTEQFIIKILQESKIYSSQEIQHTIDLLNDFQTQKEVEREKFKADELLKSGESTAAILIYQKIINADWDDTIDRSFYGKVYACLGAAYGKQFLYEQAAMMYEQAYRYFREDEILRAFLYSYYRAYPEDQYVKLLSGNATYLAADAKIKDMIQNAKLDVKLLHEEDQIRRWKEEYRNINKYS